MAGARAPAAIDSPFPMGRAVTLRANLSAEPSSIIRDPPPPPPPSLAAYLVLSLSLFRFPLVESHVLSALFTLFVRQNVFLLDTFIRFVTDFITKHVSTRLR